MSFSELSKRENLLKRRLLWLSFELVFNQHLVSTQTSVETSEQTIAVVKRCPPASGLNFPVRALISRTEFRVIIIIFVRTPTNKRIER